MKHLLLALLALQFSLLPALAAGEAAPPATATYEEWMQKAREVRSNPANSSNAATAQANARLAGEYFANAARVAPDDPKKHLALMQAGGAYRAGLDYEKSVAAYEQAKALGGVTSPDRATAALEAARVRAVEAVARNTARPDFGGARAAYSAVLQMPELHPVQRTGAHQGLAQIHAREKKPLEAALEYEQAAAPESPDVLNNLNLARLQVEQAPPSAQALALIERIFPRLLAAKIYDVEQAALRERTPAERAAVLALWGDSLLRQNAAARAVEVWTQAATDGQVASPTRFALYSRIANAQLKQEQYAAVLQTWDRVPSLPGYDFSQQSERIYGRALVFRAQGAEIKARDEVGTLLHNPQAPPDAKATALVNVGLSFKRDRDAARQSKAVAETIATYEKSAAQNFEAALNTAGASTGVRLNALLERGQLEVEAGRYAAARQWLNKGRQMWQAAPRDVQKSLAVADAKLYRIEKKYGEAMDTLSQTGQRDLLGHFNLDADVQQLGVGMLRETYEAKNWDGARQVLTVLSKWGLNREEVLLNQAEIEIAAGQPAAASAALQELAKLSLSPTARKRYEALLKKMPR